MDHSGFMEKPWKEFVNHCCIICGKNHNHENCEYIKITKYVPDNRIPSRAKLTMPNFLQLQILTDGSYCVVTKSSISKGTQFGPFQARKKLTLDPSVSFPVKIFPFSDNGKEYYLDISNENKCSWLIFVSPAEHFEEQNLICYQDKKDIYYVVIKDIDVGDTLRVWYSPYYAFKMNKPVLTPKLDIDALKNVDINTLIKKQQKIMERKIWTCKFCSQMESNIVSFAKHILKHYTAQLKKMCEICKSTFSLQKNLKSHLKIVHKSHISTSQVKPSKHFESSSKTHSKDVALGGPLLNDMFTDSSDLQQTDLNQFDLNIDNQNLLLDNDNLSVENLLNGNVKDLDHFNFEIDDSQKQFVCDICLKQFTKVKLLIVHLRHHTGDFMCFNCLKVFCRKENLISHSCNLSGSYGCGLCDKTFTQRKYLSRHFRAVHNKRFKCVSCNKSYYSNKELLEHNCSGIPNVEKDTFTCPVCDKEFYRDIYLKRHFKTHEGSRTEKTKSFSVICEICGLRLGTKNSFYLHMKRHKEPSYRCEICKKKFCRKDTLNQHILSHRRTSKIDCNICEKKFKTMKILKCHVKEHTSEEPYKCSLCEANFKRRGGLNRHLKNNHKEKSKCITIEYYSCPICYKSIKLRSSLLRHVRKVHSDNTNIDLSCIKPKFFTNPGQDKSEDLKIKAVKTTENNNDGEIPIEKATTHNENVCDGLISNDLQHEIDDQIDNLLNNAESSLSIDNLAEHKQAVDSLVKELDMETKKEQKQPREVCLSIPDLTEKDQEITLDNNAYILDNGTIIQPQGDSDNVIIYVLNQAYPLAHNG